MTTRFTAGNNTAEQRCTAQLKPETKPSKQKPMPRRRRHRPPSTECLKNGLPRLRELRARTDAGSRNLGQAFLKHSLYTARAKVRKR